MNQPGYQGLTQQVSLQRLGNTTPDPEIAFSSHLQDSEAQYFLVFSLTLLLLFCPQLCFGMEQNHVSHSPKLPTSIGKLEGKKKKQNLT